MKRRIFVSLSAAVLLALVGCSSPSASAQVLKSDKPRDTSPKVSQDDMANLVKGNNDFAVGLYQAVRTTQGNMFFSPYSVSEAMAMTLAGASGQTETDISKALHFYLDQARLHPALNALDILLASRGKNASGKDGKGFRLNVVNAVWGQSGHNFTRQYLDTLATNYGAGLRLTDFAGKPEQSRLTINTWVSDQTEQRIKDLIPSGSINDLTRLVLTNAIYFNAAWATQFQTSLTSPSAFHRLDGTDVMVPMMHESTDLAYGEGDNYQAVAIPYDGGQLSMLVILPKATQFEAFENSLDTAALQRIAGSLQTKRVTLTMPKFQFEQTLGLKQALSSMGMGIAFTDRADFSGMDGQNDLFIQDVLHKAFVSVDENGTEAAAASAVIIGTTAMPVDVAEMKMDRPFIFLIRDDATGSTLFIGRVADPSK